MVTISSRSLRRVFGVIREFTSHFFKGVLFSGTMAKQLVERDIQGNKVVVYSKSWCGYSTMAKSALREVGVQFKVIELDQREDGQQILDYLSSLTGGSTVPRVFINGKCIGGGTEIKALQHSGKLLKLINEKPQVSSLP